MLGLVRALVRGNIAEAKVAGHVDDLDTELDQLGHFGSRHLVREREQRDVAVLGGDSWRYVFEAQLGEVGEVWVGCPKRLTDKVDGGDSSDLDVGMNQ